IVASFESVGNLLVFAFLIAPPAAASLVVKRVPMIMFVAVCFGTLATVVGLLVSYHHRSAAGASMALCSVVLFFLVLTASALKQGWANRRSRPRSETIKQGASGESSLTPQA
ncbi:MAG: metal ABC transporter permease, partial [Actinobacteria bacterium]